MMTLEALIWTLFLADAVISVIIAIFFKKQYKKTLLNKALPLTVPWTLIYLLLILWVGSALFRLGVF